MKSIASCNGFAIMKMKLPGYCQELKNRMVQLSNLLLGLLRLCKGKESCTDLNSTNYDNNSSHSSRDLSSFVGWWCLIFRLLSWNVRGLNELRKRFCY